MIAELTALSAVFSAHAEVVPCYHWETVGGVGILRARGGSSSSRTISPGVFSYSPRTRR